MSDASLGSFPELSSLLAALGRSATRPDLIWTSEFLRKLVGRSKPWSYNYLRSCLTGKMKPYKPLKNAVLAGLAIVEDGAHPALAGSIPVSVLAPQSSNTKNIAGALLSGEARPCSVPGCPVAFVPNHPRRTKCYIHSPPKRRK